MQKLAANSEKDNLFTLWEQQQERVLPVGPQLEPWATPVFTTLCLFVNDYEIVRIDLAIRNKFEVKWSESCSVVSISLQLRGVGSLSLLQGIFPTHGLNLGLPHCRWILYQLSHQGSLRILEWVAYPFSRDIFSTLLHCRWILYQLSYQGSATVHVVTLNKIF